jgi:hypothetical protein
MPNAISCFMGFVFGRLRSPSRWFESEHASSTTHVLAELGCQIEQLLKLSIGQSDCRIERLLNGVARSKASFNPCTVGLGCPSRFAGGQRTVVAPRKH